MPPATATPPTPTSTPATPAATTSAQAMKNLQDYTTSTVNPTQALDSAYSKFGVEGARQQVQGLRGAITNTTNLLDQVMPSVMGRTGNSLVTSAQANRIVQNESQPLYNELGKEQTGYANANSDLQDVEGRAQNEANAVMTGQQNQMSYLQNIYKNLYDQEQATAAQKAQEAALAEQKRQFDAQMAESQRQFNQQQAISNTLSARMNALAAGSNTSTPAKSPAAPATIPSFPKGTAPSAVVGQLFQGYRPGVDKYYTENVVIPALEQLARMNNPKQSDDIIKGGIRSLVYSYRRATFGE